ncbi:MAG TPA: ABC transporter permease [Chloroflexota bacterium]
MSAPTQTAERLSVNRVLAPVLDRLEATPILGPLFGLLLLIVFFSIKSPVFFTVDNFKQIFLQVMEVGTLAVGQTLIIITGGIDLSNGAIMVFGSVLMAKLAVSGTPVPVAIAAGLGLTTALGLVNGLIVARVRLPPFIVTLGMLNVAYASTLLYTQGAAIDNLPGPLLALGATITIGKTSVPVGPLVMIAVVLIAWYALTQTPWGKHVYATGNNIEATRLSGIDTSRVLLAVYMLAGLIYGIAALLILGRTTVGDPNGGQTDNLDSITAVVIGGTSLFGGRGSVIGTFIGALIVGIIRNGLTLIGVDALWQTFATGILVVLAVAADQATRRRRR